MKQSMDAVPPRIYECDFMAMKRCKRGTFLYNVHDSFVGRSLDRYGEWCEAELDALRQFVKPGQTVLDVGANVGTHTVFFAKQVGDRGCVLAFEPQRLAYQNLCANIALNALVNVVARQQGIGRRAETARLPVFDPRKETNFGAVCLLGHAVGEPVEVIRIDDLWLGHCDLIKVDVEGMQCDVLEGARETITAHRPVLFVENNVDDLSRATIGLIDSLGYDAYWFVSRYFNRANCFGNQDDVFACFQPEVNLVCFHRSARTVIHGLPKVRGMDDNWRDALARPR
jgi:FkbM family methyltransferase